MFGFSPFKTGRAGAEAQVSYLPSTARLKPGPDTKRRWLLIKPHHSQMEIAIKVLRDRPHLVGRQVAEAGIHRG